MAAAFDVVAPCELREASANQPWPVITSGAAPQAQGPEPDQLSEKEDRSRRRATWSSEFSTAVGDTESETSRSPRSTCPVVGNVRSLSFSPEGCRRVQDALDKAASHSEQDVMVGELHGYAVKAMRCPHANHVLQKCISIMPPASLQFMIDELLECEGMVKKVAMHRYGGRIVQQLLRKCDASQIRGIAEAVLQDAVALSCHTFGHYAVIHVLEFGTAEQKYGLVRAVERNMETIARTAKGGGVILAAFDHAAAEDSVWIARAVVQHPSVLSDLAGGRRGHASVLRALSMLPEGERMRACQGLMGSMAGLRGLRYGRKVAEYLEAVAGQ